MHITLKAFLDDVRPDNPRCNLEVDKTNFKRLTVRLSDWCLVAHLHRDTRSLIFEVLECGYSWSFCMDIHFGEFENVILGFDSLPSSRAIKALDEIAKERGLI